MRRHPRRLDPADCRGHRAYSLTICTHNRNQSFTDAHVVAMVVSQILRVADEQHFEVLAYCVMADHLHAVVIAHAETADLERFARMAKQHTGYAFRRLTGKRLWQESYFDRTIRKVEELPERIAYMIRNPVRARLVEDPADYPYWGSQRYSREELLEFIASVPRV